MTLDKRVQLLQDLENEQASKSGRSPYTVKPVVKDGLRQCGSAQHDSREIHVNEAHIRNNNLEFIAIDTVLHEGRHAYQRDVVENRVKHLNNEQAQIWKENAEVYVHNSEKMFLIYYNQPLERDAQDYAYNELIKIADRLEEKHGKIDQYQRYITTVETEARFMAEKSRAKYGDDYILKIDKALRQAYSITKGLEGDKTNAREVPVMESTVNFDVTIEKNGQKVQETIAVKPFHDLRNPNFEHEPWNYAADILVNSEMLEMNQNQRETMVHGLEKRVLEAAAQTYGNDLNGVTVNIRPNYNSQVRDDALKNTLVDLMRETDPTANVEELRTAVEQSILYHKEQHSYYFPGNENNGISHGKENSFIEREITERIEQNEDTRSVVLNAASNVKDIIKGYEAVNQKNANTESYFIIINRPGEEPMAKNVAVDKNISQDELKGFLKQEANGFINEHVRNADDLNGMSVRAEKAKDLSNDGQREFYRQIGSNAAEKSFENSAEITR